jgi:hypothetical protein
MNADHPLLGREFPTPDMDPRKGERRVIDTRVDIDPTQAWLEEKDRRHAERRKFKPRPDPPSAFGKLPK